MKTNFQDHIVGIFFWMLNEADNLVVSQTFMDRKTNSFDKNISIMCWCKTWWDVSQSGFFSFLVFFLIIWRNKDTFFLLLFHTHTHIQLHIDYIGISDFTSTSICLLIWDAGRFSQLRGFCQSWKSAKEILTYANFENCLQVPDKNTQSFHLLSRPFARYLIWIFLCLNPLWVI